MDHLKRVLLSDGSVGSVSLLDRFSRQPIRTAASPVQRRGAATAPIRPLVLTTGATIEPNAKERQMDQAGNMALRAPQDWIAAASQAGAAIARSLSARPAAAGASRQEGARGQHQKGQNMTREESDQVEALIMEWYHWSRGYRPHLGVGRVAAFARGMTSDEAYDDEDVDARLAATRGEQTELCIDELPWQQRSAIGVHAGNKAAGARVFSNPRLTPEQQHAAYQEAKAALLPALRRRALVTAPQVRHADRAKPCGARGASA
ncbi:hypothetical protein [Achromobacter xylosoxidans]|uniref:hypothetical protein n=1 Tax=Alcaligenes xylosoxydans xylosoxydans TaxID=85698 RepID=UPI001EECCCDA|nr:hypothetical protein [Achromobacter xylosoxidans]